MTHETELEQFTRLLYDHKFDVDDIIYALCGDQHTGRWLLNTRTGELLAEAPEATAPTHQIQDGDDANHWHVITPLPTVFLTELATHQALAQLSADEQTQLRQRLQDCPNLQALHATFADGRIGGWLRERVKDVALEWLDSKDLIPPSMRHVYDAHAIANKPAPQGPVTIHIREDN